MKRTTINTANIFLLTFLLFSCTRLHFPARENLVDLNNDIKALDGYFDNLPGDTTAISLWNVLTIPERMKKPHKNYNSPGSYVQFQATDKHSVMARLFIDSALVEQRIFKGKIKNNYFSVKRQVRYIGLPFIYLKQSDFKIQFGRDKNNDLYIDAAYSSMGWVFIVSAGVNYKYNYVYKTK